MSGPDDAQAGVFVTSRGNAWATGLTVGVGGPLGAAAGVAVDKRKGVPSPLAAGDLAYLAATPAEVVVYKAKRGALKPKATDELLGQAARSELAVSRYKKGKMVGTFELEFTDGSSWAFDVGRAFGKQASKLAEELGSETD